MRCLIDGDILAYELGYGGEYDDEDGNHVILPPDVVTANVDQRIREIEEECWADEPSTIYLTYNKWIGKRLDKQARREGYKSHSYNPNFREGMETTRPYKGTRKPDKPFHYHNILAHLMSLNCVISDGCEADDEMAIEQTKSPLLSTVICSRDKDLRIVKGMGFGWACGRQPQFGPEVISERGGIELIPKKGIKGTGLAFFYSQLLTGDAVDNIPGLPGYGPAKTFKAFEGDTSAEEMFESVKCLYAGVIEGDWESYLLEQGRLLWMINKRDDKGELVHWEIEHGS